MTLHSSAENPCTTCPDPGYCCRGFILNVPTRPEAWKADARMQLRRLKLPQFIPLEPVAHPHTPFLNTHLRCDCRNLDQHGRCSDYGNRPALCREYQPYFDTNCILFVGPPRP